MFTSFHMFSYILLLSTCLFTCWGRNCQLPVIGFIARKTSSDGTTLSTIRAMFVLLIGLFYVTHFAVWEKDCFILYKAPQEGGIITFSPVPREVTLSKVPLPFSAAHRSCVTRNENAHFWCSWKKRDKTSSPPFPCASAVIVPATADTPSLAQICTDCGFKPRNDFCGAE